MSKQSKQKLYFTAFIVLTVLCWCPVGYGRYGEVALIFGMPSWAFVMLAVGAVLFAIEWVFLFHSDLALYDDELDSIVKDLENINTTKVQVEDN